MLVKNTIVFAVMVLLTQPLLSQTPHSKKTNLFSSANTQGFVVSNVAAFSISNTLLYNGNHTVSIFNKTTMLNDSYIKINGTYTYSTSLLLPENTFRKYKIDAFNPHGANSIEAALIFGTINTLLRKL